jgi:hypothetical protein
MAGKRRFTAVEGGGWMSYETKALFKAIIALIDNVRDLDKLRQIIVDMANAEETIPQKRDEQ